MYMRALDGYTRYTSLDVTLVDSSVQLIRNDGHAYNANLAAITADLDELGFPWSVQDYYPGIATVEASTDSDIYIWYRGGPGESGEPAPYTTMWSTDEVDDYLALLQAGKNLLLMSQSHGKEPDHNFEFNLWETGLGMQLLDPSIPFVEHRHPWAAGIATDSGTGFGGELGFFPSCPQNMTIASSHNLHFSADSANAACRYYGKGSSGNYPQALQIANCYQLCGTAYYSSFFGTGSVRPGTSLGVAAEEIEGFDLAYYSYGNQRAPDANIGFFPSYSHVQGPARLWVVGYPWAQTSITASVTGDMTRAEMLHNILGWLVADYFP